MADATTVDDIDENHVTIGQQNPDLNVNSDGDYLYYVNDKPPWPLSFFMGFQHFLLMFVGFVSVPLLLAPAMCIPSDNPARGHLISTAMFVSAIATFVQTTFGVRLPMIQGTTFSLMVPALIVLNQPQWKCKEDFQGLLESKGNETEADRNEYWQTRMREISGALCVGSLFEVFLGASGLIGHLLPYLTPLTIAPAIILIGLAIVSEIARLCGQHWGIALLTIILLCLFSQYLSVYDIPMISYRRNKGFYIIKYPFFKLFSILIGVLSVWFLSAILTWSNAFPPLSPARTDLNLRAMTDSPWIRIPYPGQWGLPTVTIGPVLGMMTGIVASVLESVGDYYACARICKSPPPPISAVNRGILVEGLCCILGGIFGSGNGTTSYSTNFAVMSLTKVASRRVIQCSALYMFLFSIFPKFGAIFVIIPSPITGGLFCILCGLTVSIGISYLKDVDINSTRNMFILGVALMFGLVLPVWVDDNPGAINTGSLVLNQVFTILLSTGMFVGGFIGFILDNTIPGQKEDPGVQKWKRLFSQPLETNMNEDSDRFYYLPYGMNWIRQHKMAALLPFSPTYQTKRKQDIKNKQEISSLMNNV